MSRAKDRLEDTAGTTRQTLFGIGGLALSDLGVPSLAATLSAALAAAAPSPDRLRLSLNESPFGPSPLTTQAIQSALSEISRYAGDDVRGTETILPKSEGK